MLARGPASLAGTGALRSALPSQQSAPLLFSLAAARRLAAAAGLPPHQELGMPSLSPTMSMGNILSWKKKEGEAIAAGDVLAEVETDKATMEWEAQDDGFLARVLLPEGSKDIPVGTPLIVIVDDEAGQSGAGGAAGRAWLVWQRLGRQLGPLTTLGLNRAALALFP